MTLIEMRMRKKRRWMRRKMRRRRRRVWLSRPHHHPTARATPSKKHQVKMKAQALMMMKMALFVKRFGKFKMKKGYHARKKKSSSKNKDEPRRCFKCNSKDHLIAECLYNSANDHDNKKSKKKEKKEKESKMTFKKKKKKKKKKKGGSYVLTWDSDSYSSDDNDSDDEKKSSKKKALASIAINEKPSLFDTPLTCFVAKATKVQSNDKFGESDDEDEPSKDEFFDMLEDAQTHFDIKRRKYKDLQKELKALK
jgi:hypothetical protein